MPMKDAARVEPRVEYVLVDRLGARVHHAARKRGDGGFKEVRLEVAVDLAVLSKREHPRAQAAFRISKRDRARKAIGVVGSDRFRELHPRARRLRAPRAASP